jgi:hypothetical protein
MARERSDEAIQTESRQDRYGLLRFAGELRTHSEEAIRLSLDCFVAPSQLCRFTNSLIGSRCETTASPGLSPLLTSLLSHCSHGGILSPLRPLSMRAFQATAEGGDRFAVVIDKGLSGETRSAMRNDGSHSTVSVVLGLALARPAPSSCRPRQMLLKLLSPILHLLPIGGPINEFVNLHSNDGRAAPIESHKV